MPEPLKVFIHIPKTAGSTLNAHLLGLHGAQVSPRAWPVIAAMVPARVRDLSVVGRYLAPRFADGATQIGYLRADPELMNATLQSSRWVSGHIPRAEMEDLVARAGRTAQFYTIMRDPVAQLASHYQWWIEIYARGPWRYLRYKPFWRVLSRRIRATDNRDPQAVTGVLRDYSKLFMNFQYGYVVGDLKVDDALARFDLIGLDADVAGVAQAMTGRRPAESRANVSRSRLDRSVFKTPEMQDFLAEYLAKDIALYDRLKAR